MSGILVLTVLLAVADDYRLPLDLGGSGPAPYVTAYRDDNGGHGALKDWNCGSTTYSGHGGTDIGIGGFAAMDAGSRWIVAGFAGRVTAVNDGCFDRCTTGNCDCGAGFGNYVRLTHPDGKSTWYGHMMRGSVQVQMNQQVSCGQRLGKVGSAGWSTGPHLHFEPRFSNNVADDPFAGPCGGPQSYWVSQGTYRGLPADRCQSGAPPPPPPPPPPPANGTVRGVIWDHHVTAGPNDPGNRRLAGTRVTSAGSPAATARAGDAAWSLPLPAGDHTIAAELAGYQRVMRTVHVVAGQEVWASIGLEPAAPGMDAGQRPAATPDAGMSPPPPTGRPDAGESVSPDPTDPSDPIDPTAGGEPDMPGDGPGDGRDPGMSMGTENPSGPMNRLGGPDPVSAGCTCTQGQGGAASPNAAAGLLALCMLLCATGRRWTSV